MNTPTLLTDNKSLSITLIAKPAFEASLAIDATLSSWRSLERFHREETSSLDLDGMEPVPGGAHLFKVVLFSPVADPESSVLMTNLVDGWRSLVHVVAKSLRCLEIQLLSTREGVSFPRNSFELWRDGESQRVIQVLRDTDRWQFYERGKPEAFEQLERYKARMIKARLTRDLIVQYAVALKWNLNDENFARPRGKSIIYTEKHKDLCE